MYIYTHTYTHMYIYPALLHDFLPSERAFLCLNKKNKQKITK